MKILIKFLLVNSKMCYINALTNIIYSYKDRNYFFGFSSKLSQKLKEWNLWNLLYCVLHPFPSSVLLFHFCLPVDFYLYNFICAFVFVRFCNFYL